MSGLERAVWRDLSMLIGAADDGTPLKIGVFDPNGAGTVMPQGRWSVHGVRQAGLASLYGTS
jgi:hypothetical protein